MRRPAVARLPTSRALVGETPRWDSGQGSLLWIDVDRQQVHRYDPRTGDQHIVSLPAPVGFVLPSTTGFVAGVGRAILAYSPTGTLLGRVVEADRPAVGRLRFNDAEADPSGRLWTGTMITGDGPTHGALLRLDPSRPDLKVVVPAVGLSNGLGWSPDGATFYHTDTSRRRIDAFDHDPASGWIGNRNRLIEFAPRDGWPDGICVDEDGAVWVALWAGARVVRVTPGGAIDMTIELPTPLVTASCFAGADWPGLIVTTAGRDASPDDADAGALFHVDVGVTGLPARPFPGPPLLGGGGPDV